MKFRLSKASNYSSDEEKMKLEELGFKFSLTSNYGEMSGSYKWETTVGEVEVNIDSLDRLVELSEKYGSIIIRGHSLTIYDDYLE